MIGYVLIAAFIVEPIVRRWLMRQKKQRTAPWQIILLWILFAFAIAGVILGWKIFMDAPHYRCVPSPYFECERFFMDRTANSPFLQYSINAPQGASCRVLWRIDENEYREEMQASFLKQHQTIYLPLFKAGTRTVSADVACM